ncbi:ATP-binding protein [Duganella sp. CY15W]|uniref:ATP-binding protein n=1 Tax=Duganella sp. CY15W TaxID=2692172 RepID=UPI001E30FFA9|nr:ATP-binding protein [Duganella sp. CY15W]
MEYVTMVSNRPPVPDAELRKRGDVIRSTELSTMSDFVYPFLAYAKACKAIDTILRESYVSRNPISRDDKHRRHSIASSTGSLALPSNWKSSAQGHMILAMTGMGKSTLINAALARYDQVIAHTEYNGEHLRCHQIVYIKLVVPFDGTIRSLCDQFFQRIDAILGTNYTRQAKSLRSIAPMVNLMHQVATTCSIGLIVVDELQNLRAAKAAGAEALLNLFSDIIERLGISLIVVGTPAVQKVMARSVRNIRKLGSDGWTILNPMDPNSDEWINFTSSLWRYSYVTHHMPLSDTVRRAWFNACGGNTAFAALAFMLAQKHEIGGREVIDKESFERVIAKDMGFLKPAINALLSGSDTALAMFDDLVFTEEFKVLQSKMGLAKYDEAPKLVEPAQPDFDEVEAEARRAPPKAKKNKPSNDAAYLVDSSIEDPFVR